MFSPRLTGLYLSIVDKMAEQEPTPEQLAEIAAANEESEATVDYKAPAQKSLQEIQDLDKDDESLRRYKEALLGKASVLAGQCVTALCISHLKALRYSFKDSSANYRRGSFRGFYVKQK